MAISLIVIATTLCAVSAFTLRESIYTTAVLRLVAVALAAAALWL